MILVLWSWNRVMVPNIIDPQQLFIVQKFRRVTRPAIEIILKTRFCIYCFHFSREILKCFVFISFVSYYNDLIVLLRVRQRDGPDFQRTFDCSHHYSLHSI